MRVRLRQPGLSMALSFYSGATFVTWIHQGGSCSDGTAAPKCVSPGNGGLTQTTELPQ